MNLEFSKITLAPYLRAVVSVVPLSASMACWVLRDSELLDDNDTVTSLESPDAALAVSGSPSRSFGAQLFPSSPYECTSGTRALARL
ncbi:hypothetical protein P691DRAFT_131786 [Macrolepiota fuliginosa MF-IS2]|uniref:Uncharacterized protein n=1 Tax=Macrolepiota fuliginosa MF-IS2 TaxID=1400762 RepID=A0A9P6C963_9AGAR|nr:hypothetical protein P691DRAFT_131786 [Macrolepiota fuliginosa MF-IS2]